MNAKNLGNKFITYTVILLKDSKFKHCMGVVEYLVSKGYKVTILSHETLEKQGDTFVFSDAIAGSDITIIFSNDCDGVFTEVFIEMVKNNSHTYVVVVVPIPVTRTYNPSGPDNTISLNDIIGWYGNLRRDQIDYLLCNPALYR